MAALFPSSSLDGDFPSLPQAELKHAVLEQSKETSAWDTFLEGLSTGLSFVSEGFAFLKPVNLISLLVEFFSAPSIVRGVNTCIRFLEMYNKFWNNASDIMPSLAQSLSAGLIYAQQSFGWFKDFTHKLVPNQPLQNQAVDLSSENWLIQSIFSGAKEMLTKAAMSIISLALPILAVVCPTAYSYFMSPKGKFNLLKTVSEVGNAFKGSSAIIDGFQTFGTYLKATVAKFLGVADPEPEKTGILKELHDLTTLITRKNDQIIGDPTLVVAETNFYRDVEKAFERADALFQKLSQQDGHYQNAYLLMQQLRTGLQTLKTNYNGLINNVKGKMIPVTIWIYGPSGHGKSFLATYIISLLSQMHGRTLSVYNRNPVETFFGGYMGQDVCIYDDFGCSKESLDHQELVSIYTPAPFLPKMAEAELKGRVRFTSSYVIICSNMAYPAASKVLVDPSILQRRRDFLINAEAAGMIRQVGETGMRPPDDFFRPDCSHLALKRKAPHAVNGNMVDYDAQKPFMTAHELADAMFELYTARHDQYVAATEERVAHLRAGTVTFDATVPPPAMARRPHVPGGLTAEELDWIRLQPNDGWDAQSDDTDVENQTNHVITKPRLILFMGPPGIGKTELTRIFPEQNVFDEIPTRSDFKELIDICFQEDRTPTHRLVVMTANPTTLRRKFQELWGMDHYHAFLRRCVVVMFKFRTHYGVTYTTADLQKKDKKTGCLKHPYDKLVKTTVVEYGTELSHCFTLPDLRNYLLADKATHTVRQVFELPFDDNFVADDVYSFPVELPIDEKFRMGMLTQAKLVRGSRTKFLKLIPSIWRHKMPPSIHTYEAIMIYIDQLNIDYTDTPFAIVLPKQTFGVRSVEGKLRIFRIQDIDVTDFEQITGEDHADLLSRTTSMPILDLLFFCLKVSASVASIVLMTQKTSQPFDFEATDWGSIMDEEQPLDPDDSFKKVARASRDRVLQTFGSSGIDIKPKTSFASLYAETNRRPEFTWVSESSEMEVALRKKNAQPVFQHEAVIDQAAMTISEKVTNQTFTVVNKDGTPLCHAIGLKGHLYVTNEHAKESGELFIMYDKKPWPTRVVSSNTLKDHLFLEVPLQVPAVADITGHLCSKNTVVRDLSGSFAMLNIPKNQKVLQRVVQLDAISTRTVANVKRFGLGYRGSLAGYTYDPICTQRGDCGSPLIAINPALQTKLLGFHSAANETYGIAALLYKEDIPDFQNQSFVILAHQLITPVEPEPICNRLQIIARTGTPEKSVKLYYPSQTKIFKSPFHGMRFGEATEPAVLSLHDSRCSVGADPLIDALTKWDCEQIEPDQVIMDEVFDDLSLYFAQKVRESGYRMKILTKTEAINRVTNIPTSNPLYRKTSPGYPFKTWKGATTKDVFFRQKGDIFLIAENEQGKALNHCIDRLVDTARQGNISAVTFFGCLKDEPRKLAKIYDTTTTRSIIACPIDYTLAHRQYFHTASAAITALHRVTPIKIGINPQSLDWHALYHYHARVSDVGFDVDYAGWDYHVTKHVLSRIPRIYNAIYKACDPDWKLEHDTIRINLHAVMLEPLVLINDLVVKCPGGQPTGQPQTALDNSLANFAHFLYAWKILVKGHPELTPDLGCFLDTCAISFYGDDNITTVKSEYVELLNFQTFAKVIRTLGSEITDNAKSGATLKVKPLQELEFLKRHFVMVDRYWFGQLDLTSLNKILDWCHCQSSHHFDRDRETVKYPPDIGETVTQIQLEACLHTPELYDAIVAHIQNRCAQYKIRANFMPCTTARSRLLAKLH